MKKRPWIQQNFAKIFLFGLVVTLMVTFCSCLTVDRIKKNCDQFAAVCVTDAETIVEYRDTTIYLHDTIEIQMPADTVKLTDTLTIREGKAYLAPIEKHFGYVGVKAWVNNSVLNAWGYLRDSTILQPVHDTLILDNIFRTETTTKYIELPPEKYVSKWHKFTNRWFWLTLVVIAVLVGRWWLIRKYRKLKDLM